LPNQTLALKLPEPCDPFEELLKKSHVDNDIQNIAESATLQVKHEYKEEQVNAKQRKGE
jgi:hypothetical protein